jgi:ribose/xylose/arabinose/galactoside ABC-type transport system permease subunit
VLAAITAAILEVVIFSFIFRKSSNFFISTISSVVIILFAHNIITDYPLLKADPNAWKIIFNGLSMNISVMVIYAAIITAILTIVKKYNLNNNKIPVGDSK